VIISRFQSETNVVRDDNNIHTFDNFWELEEHIQQSKSTMGTMQWKKNVCPFECVSAVKQFGGILPVSDDVTGDIYVNKLCAVCHDVTTTTPWQMSVECFIESDHINYINVMLAVSKGSDFPDFCEVHFHPPYQHPRYDQLNFLDDNNLRCIKSLYDTFPRKCLDWFESPLIYNVSKEEIVAACENTSDLFEFGYGLDRLDVFIDKMCAICHGMYNQVILDSQPPLLNIPDINFYQMERPPAKEPSTKVCDRITNVVCFYCSYIIPKGSHSSHKCGVYLVYTK